MVTDKLTNYKRLKSSELEIFIISLFRRRYKGLNEGLNVSLGHKGAPLPTLCLPYITVPRNGEKRHI